MSSLSVLMLFGLAEAGLSLKCWKTASPQSNFGQGIVPKIGQLDSDFILEDSGTSLNEDIGDLIENLQTLNSLTTNLTNPTKTIEENNAENLSGSDILFADVGLKPVEDFNDLAAELNNAVIPDETLPNYTEPPNDSTEKSRESHSRNNILFNNFGLEPVDDLSEAVTPELTLSITLKVDEATTVKSDISKTTLQFSKTTSQFSKTNSQFRKTISQFSKTTSQLSKTTSEFSKTTSEFIKTTSQFSQPAGQLRRRRQTLDAQLALCPQGDICYISGKGQKHLEPNLTDTDKQIHTDMEIS